jgi:hypothetical protein
MVYDRIKELSMSQMSRAQAEARILYLENQRKYNRQVESDLKTKRNALNDVPLLDSQFLESNLKIAIPRNMAPKNIGNLAGVMWDFWFPLSFDFGVDPTYDSTTRQAKKTQVTQEAGFLLTGMIRSNPNLDGVSFGAPLGVTIRDLQSTRQFNDKPIPVQFIGDRGKPTMFQTPLLIRPNANIEIEVSSLLNVGESIEYTGASSFDITLRGIRVRDFNDPRVLTSIFL